MFGEKFLTKRRLKVKEGGRSRGRLRERKDKKIRKEGEFEKERG